MALKVSDIVSEVKANMPSTPTPKPPAKKKLEKAIPEPEQIKCVCCGKKYKSTGGFFPKSPSPLFKSNNNIVPICRNCIMEYWNVLIDAYQGNAMSAMHRYCQLTDQYFNETAARNCHSAANPDIISPMYYYSKNAEAGTARKSYLDCINEEELPNVQLNTEDDIERLNEIHEIEIPADVIKRWGLSWSADEYRLLEEHYDILRHKSLNADEQELQIHDLCEMYVLKYRARLKGDITEYEKCTKLYNTTYQQCNFRNGINNDDSFNKPLGLLNFIIEGKTPSEYYKDKTLYKDMEGYEDYTERYLIRPFRNFIQNKNDMDVEYSIKEDEN